MPGLFVWPSFYEDALSPRNAVAGRAHPLENGSAFKGPESPKKG